LIDIDPRELSWLQRFFAPENHLVWADLADETAPLGWRTQVLPWLEFVKQAPLERPLVLPVFGLEGAYRWYGLADSERAATQMVQELQGFVGPSLSDFAGHLIELSANDPIEFALRERFGPFVARFEAISSADRKAIERKVSLYHSVLVRRPPTVSRGRRPFGRVRGDFDRALLAGNAEGAQRFLEELCESGRVTAEQRKYLDIRYLAGLGRYEELARNQALIAAIVELALPPQTLLDVVGALYRIFVGPLELNPDIGVIQESFKKHIGRAYGPLFRERKGIRQPEVLRAFLLYESVLDEPNLTRCESLIQAYPKEAPGLDLAEKILAKVRNRAPASMPEALAQARQAIADEDYVNAVALCFKALPDQWAFKAMLRCAVEIEDIAVIKRVLNAIEDAGENLVTGFSTKDNSRLDQIRHKVQEVGQQRHDGNWCEWAQWVITEPEGVAALTVLENAVVSWSVDEYVQSPEKCLELARSIGNAGHDASKVFRDALPQLFEFFVDSPAKASRTLVPIYVILLKIIGWSGIVSPDELRLTSGIAEALLASGPQQEDYDEALMDLTDILKANEAPTNLDWALNIAELLAMYPSSNSDARLRVFMAIFALVRAWGHRVSFAQRTVITMLGRDYQCTDLITSLPPLDASESTDIPQPQFAGLIGIYSLSESSGHRAREALHAVLPAARVELNSDTVATDRLRTLARSADVFVFAWKKSTHQAYYCAKDARGARDLVMPSGGGTASLVQAVLSKVTALLGVGATEVLT